jgi:phosphatidylglycerophosphatase A
MSSTSTERPPVAKIGTRAAPLWATLTGTFFYIGRMKPGPGTWASVATVLLWRGLGGMLQPAWQMPAAIAAAAAATAIGIPAATRVARAGGDEDPSYVVVDEVAGQLIALIGAPLGWKSLLAGLILFRFFDILKPPPLRRLEKLPEGVGIMMDDVGAGLYALAIIQALLHLGVLQ